MANRCRLHTHALQEGPEETGWVISLRIQPLYIEAACSQSLSAGSGLYCLSLSSLRFPIGCCSFNNCDLITFISRVMNYSRMISAYWKWAIFRLLCCVGFNLVCVDVCVVIWDRKLHFSSVFNHSSCWERVQSQVSPKHECIPSSTGPRGLTASKVQHSATQIRLETLYWLKTVCWSVRCSEDVSRFSLRVTRMCH